jgi:ABC-type proline/glycine betaine transport system ATPase subunit
MELESADSGSIFLRGREVTHLAAGVRNFGYVPQSFALYPHYRVFENIVLAFARAVARQSSIILFDEPITNVDARAKFQLKQDLKIPTDRLKQTIIYVTHDQKRSDDAGGPDRLAQGRSCLAAGVSAAIVQPSGTTFWWLVFGEPRNEFLKSHLRSVWRRGVKIGPLSFSRSA